MPDRTAARLMQTTTRLKPLAERVETCTAGAARLLVLPTPVRSIVSFRGSFKTYPDFAAGTDLVQDLAVQLLDKGTRRRDRFAIAEVLENRGVELDFHTDGLWVRFSGRALRDDLPEVIPILTEQLREPLFDPGEFEKAKAHLAASLERSRESTAAQASAALARRLYPRAHPNYRPDPADDLARLAALTVDDVRAFHARHFGANDLTIVFVGDVDPGTVEALVREGPGAWTPAAVQAPFAERGRAASPGRTVVPMPDKENVDVRMGHPLPVRRQDPAFIPLYVANYILGGNFSARLMSTVRDEMGLTYGIYSTLYGVTTEYEGHWQVDVTLSRENVERGVEATLAEVRRFVEAGVTREELDEKKTTITGRFKVDLATTGGLAANLLRNAERGFDVGYLDRFPGEVEALTLAQVNEAVQAYFDPGRFHIALAGSLPD
ncbi:M16 family metallopeptidase [Rhodocaloribacter litoris]|uniref:M16 family metallopeptidase n=1 Tax=Rhodocaloribacter litoris TaxID=2558931 RepID=UPI001E5E601F|nr:pitrilysin family protein [Rhodocaloribacter litoris]